MSIDNISRIYEKDNEFSYVFDVPSKEDENAIDSYILRAKRHDSNLSKITDLKYFLYNLKTVKAKEVNQNSKDYLRFQKLLKDYIIIYEYRLLLEEEINDNISQEDVKNIAVHYKELLLKK